MITTRTITAGCVLYAVGAVSVIVRRVSWGDRDDKSILLGASLWPLVMLAVPFIAVLELARRIHDRRELRRRETDRGYQDQSP